MKQIPRNPQGNRPQATESNSNVVNTVFRLALFDHLPRKQVPKDPDSIEEDRNLHLATIHLGLMFNKGQIQSDDDRVDALIRAFVKIIQDYKTPPKKVLREDLDKYISKQVQYLVDNRQLSKGMGNVIKYIRQSISKISPELSEADAKEILLCNLQTFIEEKIVYAGMSIARFITSIINDGEVILTFGSSPLIRKVLLYASEHKKFRLVVVDTRPLNEGLQTLSSLSGSIHCVYSPISATPVVLKDVTKVILGASCLLSNGSMLAAAGTAMVAALAKQRQIPVIVASESYKFSDKVQLDSIVFNELGNANEIVTVYKNNNNNLDEPISTSFQTNPNDPNTTYFIAPQREAGYKGSADKHTTNTTSNNNNNDDNNNNNNTTNDNSEFIQNASNKTLSNMKLPFDVINLRYDLTPLNNISVIATETGLIPPTSIPVLIREIQSDTK